MAFVDEDGEGVVDRLFLFKLPWLTVDRPIIMELERNRKML
jgi:hypothetical protein